MPRKTEEKKLQGRTVRVRETHVVTYWVESTSDEDAMNKVLAGEAGEGQFVDLVDTNEPNEWKVTLDE